jgi:hypothetical protein
MVLGMSRRAKSHTAFLFRPVSGTGPDPATVIQRSRPFAAGVASVGQASMLTIRGEVGIDSYLITPEHPRAATLAANLAHTVGAEAHPCAQLPVLDPDGAVGWVVARPQKYGSRDTQQGGDPVEVARLLGREMTPGSWVAMTVRQASRREVDRSRRWYDFRLGGTQTHHSKEGEPLIFTLLAGGPDTDTVKALLSALVASLPGFDIEIETRTGHPLARVLGFGLSAPVLGVGVELGTHSVPAAIAATVVPATVALGYAAHRIPNRLDQACAQRDTLHFRTPDRLIKPPKSPRKESTSKVRRNRNVEVANETRTLSASPGDYPLHPTSFIVGSSVIVGIIAPYTGTASGVTATASVTAPPALLGDIGAMVGTAGGQPGGAVGKGGQPVRISAADQIEGVGIVGLPGRGKSILVSNLFAFDVLERVRPSGKPGRCGKSNTLIAFENKGSGVTTYQRWIGALGDTSILIDLADETTPGIDLLAIPGTGAERADFLANMMQYVFGKQAIADQSMNTLKAVFHAAFLLPPELAASVLDGGFDAHPLAIGHGLLSGYGDEEGEALAAAYVGWAKKLDEADPLRADAIAGARKLALLYGPRVTPAQRRTLTSAPISKTGLLVGAGYWWSSGRAKTTWRDILHNHWAVVINTGPAVNDELEGAVVGSDITAAFSAMLAYTLRDAILRTCKDWQSHGRYVTIFADELSLLAGSSGEVITWLRNQGRDRGVRLVLATQYLDQLEEDLMTAVMGYSTFFWFAQNSATVKADAVADLGGEGARYSADDIANLAPYRAIMRTVVGKQAQPPVPVDIAYWGPTETHPRGREHEFAYDQGYDPIRPPAPTPAISLDDYTGGGPVGETLAEDLGFDLGPDFDEDAPMMRDYDPAHPFAAFEG